VTERDWTQALDAINTLLRIFAPVLGGWAIYLLRQTVKELRGLATGLAAVMAWQEAHDRLDDTRFEALQRELDGYRERLGLPRVQRASDDA
jgi:hypothetical protein